MILRPAGEIWYRLSVGENAKKKYASRFDQLKTGHGAVGTFLARIGAIETPECWWCGVLKQTVVHIYKKCWQWRRGTK